MKFFSNSDFLLAYVATFSDSFIFGEATSSHDFRVTTSTLKLLWRSTYFFRAAAFLRSSIFRTVTLSQHLFFQNNFFFREKLLWSSHIFRIGSSLGQLLFGTGIFLVKELFRIRYLQKSYFFEAGTSAQHQLFQKSYILEKVTFLGKQYSALPIFSGELSFYQQHLLLREKCQNT